MFMSPIELYESNQNTVYGGGNYSGGSAKFGVYLNKPWRKQIYFLILINKLFQ